MKKARGLALLTFAGGLLFPQLISAREAKINASLGTGIYLSALNEPLFEFRGSVGLDRKYIGGGFNLAYITGKNGEMDISISRLEALSHLNLPIGNRVNLRAGAGGTLISRSEKIKKTEERMIEGSRVIQDPTVTYGTDMLAVGPVVNVGLDIFDKTGNNNFYLDLSWSSAGVKSFGRNIGGFSGVVGIGFKY